MSRRRYRYNPDTQQMEEVGADWTDAEKRAPTPTEELTYGKLGVSTDGVDISTKRRHREYMHATGTTVSSDFTETWAKARQQREAFYTGKDPASAREAREDVGRALYQLRKRK